MASYQRPLNYISSLILSFPASLSLSLSISLSILSSPSNLNLLRASDKDPATVYCLRVPHLRLSSTMEDQEGKTPKNLNPKQPGPALCEECKSKTSNYKCPACFFRSCSLPCVNAHKLRTGCTGKRKLTEFVPLSQFDDNLILSDYNMLEEVRRVAESAQRMRFQLGSGSNPYFRLPIPLKKLKMAASSRRTKLSFLPSGMSKRKTNQTYYDIRNKLISWTIEWRFNSTDIVLIDHRVNENTNLCTVIENHLGPGPWTHQLKQFCDEPLDSLKFFICKYPKNPRSPYRELDIKAPLREQLANLFIVEYPVIHVYLPSHSYHFDVLKDATPKKPETRSCPSPIHVVFREEELKDEDSPEPQVLDLMKHMNPNVASPKMHHNKGTRKNPKEVKPLALADKLVANEPAANKPVASKHLFRTEPQVTESISRNDGDHEMTSDSKTMDGESFEDMDFNFEQGIVDAYPDLFLQSSPSEFLDWEGMLNEPMEEMRDQAGFNHVSVEQELEEGEIPES